MKMKNKTERWRWAKGYKGRYKITSFGRVWSMLNKRFLNPVTDTSGHLQVRLCKPGQKKLFCVHRLVQLETYLAMSKPSFFNSTSLPVLSGQQSRTPACGVCGLYKTCKSPKMPVSGLGRKKILVVAEAPGKDEDAKGIQLVGASGQELIKHMRAVGLDMRKDCWLTNAIICRPPNNEIPNDNVVSYCRPNLVNTIELLKPELIIVLGSTACESLFGWLWKGDNIGGINKWRGYQIPNRRVNAWICPTYHPAHILRERDPVYGKMFHQHLKAASMLVGTRPWPKGTRTSLEHRIQVIFDPEEAADLIEAIQMEGLLTAFDFETTTLKPEGPDAKIVYCSISNGNITISYPWSRLTAKATKKYLLDKDINKVGSNIQFEERWCIHHLGINVRGWFWDTMTTGHAIDNAQKGRSITSIKFQAHVRVGVDLWDERIKPYLEGQGGNGKNRIMDADPKAVMIYNGLDSLYELITAKTQMREKGIEV